MRANEMCHCHIILSVIDWLELHEVSVVIPYHSLIWLRKLKFLDLQFFSKLYVTVPVMIFSQSITQYLKVMTDT